MFLPVVLPNTLQPLSGKNMCTAIVYFFYLPARLAAVFFPRTYISDGNLHKATAQGCLSSSSVIPQTL